MRATAQLESRIPDSFADARTFHGDLGLSASVWRDRVLATLEKCSDRAQHGSTASTSFEHLHTRDLYLTTACAAGLELAWCRFGVLYQRYIRELVRSLARNPLQASDVSEAFIVDLFLPDRSGRSRIASYDGRSSLPTWLHVIVTHRVANERVRKWSTVERPGDLPEVPDRSLLGELEAALRAERYGDAVADAVRRVCCRLSARERQILVWRYQRGLLLEEIAERLSVHTSTAYRQLERLQERIRRDVIETLLAHGLNDRAIRECLWDVAERRSMPVSILRLIRADLPAGDSSDNPLLQSG